jgi:vitamin B12 transporter
VELAAKGKLAAARWRVSLFATQIHDLIGFDSNYLPANVDAARIRGLEASAAFPWGEWQLETGASVLDTENRTNDANRGNELARRPKRAGHVDLARGTGPWQFGARLIAEGARHDDAGNSRRLHGFATLDLRAEYALAQAWRLQARVANLFDKSYETVAFYNQPGRAFYLTLRYSGAAQ